MYSKILAPSFFRCLVWTLLASQTCSLQSGYFWHVTDVHLDLNYTADGDPNNMCWSIGPSDPSAGASEFGNYNCDAPKELVRSAVNAMKEIFPEPDFIIWTGDDTAHVNDSFFSNDIVFDVISDVTNVINETFPDTLVLPVLGNHDLFPQNQAPVGPNDFQTRVADLWKSWLDQFGGYEDFYDHGRFAADIPETNITIIGLNTLVWYQFNDITNNDPSASDPGGQFEWLDLTVKNLSANGRQVYLMGHIPPGTFERYFDEREGFHWYQDRYNEKYINLVKSNSDKITAQFSSHHHTDSFRIFLDNNESVSYMLIAPAVSPMKSTLSDETGANNPGIRLVEYDRETGEVLEVSQYYNDLASTIQTGVYNWGLEYNLTELLEISKINGSSLYEAALRMKVDREFFDNYHEVNTVRWSNTTKCSESCRLTQFCAITQIDYSDFYECNFNGTVSFQGRDHLSL